ncbi:hypothetical protein E2R51_03975 [Jeotgalibacillus sp. S-D1]|uniref:hypothetical protein n=1 Tax=Jeotgalibacillus sp. S-D1 TaxID=2552189 RepID=UPI00105A324B|nr:hypothetical protein [Jeotgalibacillus sp. S-D1]TDL34890.1 hypothetical protein E2R51_03975 [Jeotgalibacillus sp. S-D1]
MWNHLNEQQLAIQSEINARDKLIRKKNILEKQLNAEEIKKETCYKKFSKEQQEVHDLDHFSFINTFRKLSGSMEEVKEKEIAEAAEAEIKWNEAVKMTEDLKHELADINQKISNPKWVGLDSEWKLLMEKKENWLRTNSQKDRKQLDSLYDIRNNLELLETEISEAHEAGLKSVQALNKAAGYLNSAKSMSTWDTFLGGGLIATAMKHSSLNESEDAIHKAQLELHRFEAELQDVNESVTEGLKVDRGSFLTFADYFFDDIFTEWTMHSRINSSINNVNKMIDQVETICRDLKSQQTQVNQQINEIKQELTEIIQG